MSCGLEGEEFTSQANLQLCYCICSVLLGSASFGNFKVHGAYRLLKSGSVLPDVPRKLAADLQMEHRGDGMSSNSICGKANKYGYFHISNNICDCLYSMKNLDKMKLFHSNLFFQGHDFHAIDIIWDILSYC